MFTFPDPWGTSSSCSLFLLPNPGTLLGPQPGVPDAEVEETKVKAETKKDEPGRIRVPQHRLVHSGHLDLSDFMEVNLGMLKCFF